MVHDRRIDGTAVTFGNASSLYMSAMTWWDYDTESIWSQPWGRAIQGELKGVELFLLPSQITSWASWQELHPQTLILTNDLELMPNLRQTFKPDFVIGISIDQAAKAYRFNNAVQHTLINDTINQIPVLIYASDDTYHTYIRNTGSQTLTFQLSDGELVDLETGSHWDIDRGLAINGPLRGQTLQSLPSISAFEDHWLDFYPNSEIWSE